MSRRIFLRTILAIVIAVFGLVALSGNLYAQGQSDQGLERAIAAQEKHTDALMAKDGVEGTAVGLDENGSPVVKVFTAAQGIGGIPANLEGVPVEVVVTGKFVARVDPTARFDRPVPIGVSTGHPDITAGTIGCRVTDGSNVYALSNNHVYANQNKANYGDAVIQPGTYDGGSSPADDIGTLYDFEPIKFAKGLSIPLNTIDAAIALSSTGELGTAAPGTPGVDSYGTPSSTTVSASVGMKVQKYGRTTEWTVGSVDSTNATVDVSYGQGKVARFIHQIVITPGGFSAGGDSGSLILTYNPSNSNEKKPVGLLFAGSSSHTIANRIVDVLSRFNVSIDSSTTLSSSTTGSISGVVTSSAGSGFIVGATVTVDTGQSDTTDASGIYTLSNVPTGNRSVTASADGFESNTKLVTVNENQTAKADFSLTPAASGGALIVGVSTDSASYTLGDRVYITVTVTDGSSQVQSAAVHVEITTASNKLYAGDSTTDSNGVALFSFKTKKPDGTGTYTITAGASKSGYGSGSDSTTFYVN